MIALEPLRTYTLPMNARLQSLIHAAETRLGAADQARLEEIVEAFVAVREGAPDFSPDERDHLGAIDAEPFKPADAAEVAALFARRG